MVARSAGRHKQADCLDVDRDRKLRVSDQRLVDSKTDPILLFACEIATFPTHLAQALLLNLERVRFSFVSTLVSTFTVVLVFTILCIDLYVYT